MKGKTRAEVVEELKKTGASEEKINNIAPHKVSVLGYTERCKCAHII